MTVLQYSNLPKYMYKWQVHVNTVMEFRARKREEDFDYPRNYKILKTNCDTSSL